MNPPPLVQLVQKLPSFTISKDGIPYLTRYYAFLADREFGNIFIHHFHRSDMDLAPDGQGLLHNHPFDWSFSIVLSGGYIEERRQSDDTIIKKIVQPGELNFLSKKDYHRVDLLDEEKGAWTIFFTGSRKNNDWEFWDRTTKRSIPWRNVVGALA